MILKAFKMTIGLAREQNFFMIINFKLNFVSYIHMNRYRETENYIENFLEMSTRQ
jgi:hypothetical protein